MAVTVDWPNRIVNVPKSFLTLVQSTPSEIYNMDLNAFRLACSDALDDPEGMPFPDIYQHNTTVLLSGIEYARVIEIINGYTVTFEDDQYAVNLIGANSNVQDVVNVNQVSVRSANSAGMTSSAAVEHSEFEGGVTLDLINGVAGTFYPTGTQRQPVNNLADAKLIAEVRGFTKIYVIGNLTLGSGDNLSAYHLAGQGATMGFQRTTITFEAGYAGMNTTYEHAYIQGVQGGESNYIHCVIGEVSNTHCSFQDCTMVGPNTLYNQGAPWEVDHQTELRNCNSTDDWYVVDYNNSPVNQVYTNFSGKIKIINFTDSRAKLNINMDSGCIWLDASCTAGEIYLSGVAGVLNDSSIIPIDEGNINKTNISVAVWDEPLTGATHNLPTSAGRRLRALSSAVIYEGEVVGPGVNGNQVILEAGAADYDGAYDPATISITEGAGIGQTRNILEYEGATRTATVDRDWKVLPDNTSIFVILGNAGREHVNEGLARGGSANTIKLNPAASTVSGSYVGEIVFIRSGTGQDQSRPVISYDGPTQTATMEHDWHTVPDTTSAYVMLPHHVHLVNHIVDAVWDANIPDYQIPNSAGLQQGQLLKLSKNKAVISPDGLTVTIYEDDGVTPHQVFAISADSKTRTPI